MNYNRFLTHRARQRKRGGLRAMVPKQDNIALLGGLPTPDGNPVTEATFVLRNGSSINITPDLMKDALQYKISFGYAPLMEEINKLLYNCHTPPLWSDTEVVPTVGSMDGIARAFDITIDQGDYVIIADPCYQAVITLLNAYDAKFLSVESDDEGPRPESLRAVLAQWDPKQMSEATSGVPKVMYLNPCSTNPSGVTSSNARRREIYQIACEYNLLILEDDAYYFLQYGPRDSWSQSYLSMDTHGRVLRFDSCSKILAAGLRLGFVTGPKYLVEAIQLHLEVSAMQPASLSQVLVAALLKQWGEEGFWNHVAFMNDLYKKRRDAAIEAAEKHLKGLCEWNKPGGGMFLWVKIPGLKDTWPLVKRCIEKGVTFGPGAEFGGDQSKPSNYIRIAYSSIPLDQLDKGFQRLADGIREELILQK